MGVQIKKEDFTHYASFRGVPCYWNNDNYCLSGRNIVYDLLLEYVAVPFDSMVSVLCGLISADYEPGFRIKLTGEIT